MEGGGRQAAPTPRQQHVPRASSRNRGNDEELTAREQTKDHHLSSDAHHEHFCFGKYSSI